MRRSRLPGPRGLALILILVPGLEAAARNAVHPAQSCELIVHVDGFRNHKGVIGGAAYSSSAGWPEEDSKAAASGALPITAEPMSLSFHVAPGTYGIVVLHDENANHHLDRNVFRVPKEGFGFANNPRVGLSAPTWQSAAVPVVCPRTETNIHLIYK